MEHIETFITLYRDEENIAFEEAQIRLLLSAISDVYNDFISFYQSNSFENLKNYPELELKLLHKLTNVKHIFQCLLICCKVKVSFHSEVFCLFQKLVFLLQVKIKSVEFLVSKILSIIFQYACQIFLEDGSTLITILLQKFDEYLSTNHVLSLLNSVIIISEFPQKYEKKMLSLLFSNTLNAISLNIPYENTDELLLILKFCEKLALIPTYCCKTLFDNLMCFIKHQFIMLQHPSLCSLYLQVIVNVLPTFGTKSEEYQMAIAQKLYKMIASTEEFHKVLNLINDQECINEMKTQIQQNLVILIYKCMLCNISENESGHKIAFGNLQNVLKDESKVQALIDLFLDEDDALVNLLLLNLHLFIKQKQGFQNFHCFNPHVLFNCFLSNVSYDTSLLVDWTISNETCFLRYILQYVKFINTTWHANLFREFPSIEKILLVLEKLKASLIKLHAVDAVPFNPTPLIKHIVALELKYKS